MSVNKRPILDSTTYYNNIPASMIDDMKKSISELQEKVKKLETRLDYFELSEDEELNMAFEEDDVGCQKKAKGKETMQNLKIRQTINANFDAEEWELYTESKDCSEVADTLNRFLEHLVNEGGYDKRTVMDKMMEKMKQFSDYGAYDSEPIWFLESVVNRIYK